jgi:hypothetical protein
LRQIGPYAFLNCRALKSISISASIEVLGEDCFHRCDSLSEIIFEFGSKLTRIGRQGFVHCFSLTSICIPANVENIPDECCSYCTSLVEVSFELGSKLTRIEDRAFLCCCSLRSIVLPAQLEIIACGVFTRCDSLCEMKFDLPSSLKQLDLPASGFGSLCIPDCVEIVFGGIGTRKDQGRRRLLHFGGESCVTKIELRHWVDLWDEGKDKDTDSDAFVRLSEKVLRRFRSQFECF